MHSERLLEAASAMTDLTDEQREKIKQMREEHTAKFKELRPKAVERMIEQQSVQSELMGAKDDDARMKAMDRMNKLYSSENPRDKMREADKEIVKQVRGLLTVAQREKLPKRPRPTLPFDIKPAGDDGSK
jgi:Spy/CpxP family protein refolding chaperone